MSAESSRFGRYEILERQEIDGGGFDALARGPDGRDVRLWVGAAGSGAPGPGGMEPDRLCHALAQVYQAGLPRPLAGEVVEARALLVVQAYRGETLAQRLASGPMEPTEAIDRVRGIAAALVKAHRAGLAHGAIAPQEILLAEDGRTLLLHLGFAPFLGARGEGEGPPSESGDVFALAGVLHRCLLGPEPALPPTEESLPAELPQGLRRLLARALHADPSRRMRRAEELAGDLAVIRASWGAPREPTARRLGLPRSVPGRLALAAAAAALVAVALRVGRC